MLTEVMRRAGKLSGTDDLHGLVSGDYLPVAEDKRK